MPGRLQNTIAREGTLTGVGFFTGADVTVRFLPADEHTGIRFQRVDLPGEPTIPATIEYAVSMHRRTALANGNATVELTEHVLAALAGLRIDNCIVQLNAPELPGCDGSAKPFADCLLETGIVQQTATRETLAIDAEVVAKSDDGLADIRVQPLARPSMTVSYQLDYGHDSPIAPQALSLEITPRTFLDEIVFARTFILEAEVEALRAAGYGERVTQHDLLVFGPNGVIDNRLRARDECVRHKILDCIGDLALLGCGIQGHVAAYRSGHELNRALVRRICEDNELMKAA